MKKKLGFGRAIAAALFAASVAFWGCSNPSGGDTSGSENPTYTVKVEPASVTVMQGGTKQFTAKLQLNGQNVNDSYTTTWALMPETVTSGTAINSGGTLTVAATESSTTLTVTATITYNGTPYTGTASVTIESTEAVVSALDAIKDAAATSDTDATAKDALLAALKNPKTGLDVSLILDANKDAYFESKSSFISCLTGISSDSSATEIRNAISQLESQIKTINFTAETRTTLTAFNAASDAAAIGALLTESNFKALNPEDDEGTELWTLYNALTGKTGVAQSILQSRTNSGGQFSDSVILAQAISQAVYSQQQAEATALVSSFDNKSTTQIAELLTQNNFIILKSSAWEMYQVLDAANKTKVAEKLANRPFTESNVICDAIETAVQEILIEVNRGQIKQKLNVALGPTATAAQVNDLLTFAASVFGYTIEASDKLTSSNESSYRSTVTHAKAGDYGFSAIKAYSAAGTNPNDTLISAALQEIFEIISSVKSGVSYGTLTLNNVPTTLMYLYVQVYDAMEIPASQTTLDNLTRVAQANLSPIPPGAPITLGLRWQGFTASKARNFVVVINGQGDFAQGDFTYIGKIGLVQFNAAGDATVNIDSLTDTNTNSGVESPAMTTVTITNVPGGLSRLDVQVYDATVLPVSQNALYSDMDSLLVASVNTFPTAGTTTTAPLQWHRFNDNKNRAFVVNILGYSDDININKIGLIPFDAAGDATVDVNTLEDTEGLGKGKVTINNLPVLESLSVTVYDRTSAVGSNEDYNEVLYSTDPLGTSNYLTTITQPVYITWENTTPPANNSYVVTFYTNSGMMVGFISFTNGNATVNWNADITAVEELDS